MQTPIEQLIERLEAKLAQLDSNNNFDSAKTEILRFAIYQAKELLEVELEVIKTAFTDGHESTYVGCDSGCGANYYLSESSEQYYNEQFKNQ